MTDVDRPARTAEEWLSAFSSRLGRPAPTPAEVEVLLELAGVAAHASQRIAAPIACWLVGSADLPAEAALELAREI